ncbi:MFS transporter [Massilia cavernae]|nr:MFS transporter [Massilia cavernae]
MHKHSAISGMRAGNSRTLRVAYGVGAFGALLCYAPIPLLFLYYLTEYAGISPALAGMILAIPKIFDLALDPWIGRSADRFAQGRGSRIAVLRVCIAILPLSMLLLFLPLPKWPPATLALFYAALLIVQSYTVTAFSVAHTALAGDLSEEPAAQASLLSARAFGSTLAGLGVAGGAPLLIAASGGGHRGYLVMALVLGLAAAAALLWCCHAARGTPLRSAGAAHHRVAAESLWRDLGATVANRAFYAIALMLVLIGIGSSSFLSLLPYVNKYLLYAPPERLSVLLVPIFLALLGGVAVAPAVFRRLGTTAAMLLALTVSIAGVLLVGMAIWRADDALLIASCALFGFGGGVMTVLIATTGMQLASVGGAGEGRLGLYLGILFSAEKLGQSIGGIAAGGGLSLVHITPGAASIGPEVAARLGVLTVAAPLASMTACLCVLLASATGLKRHEGVAAGRREANA